MRYWKYRIWICLLGLLLATAAGAQTKTRKTVFVLVDGIPPDVLERVATPHLDSIAQRGSYQRAYVGGAKGGYSESPTISAVGYNSLLTGTWANKHNVWNNDIKEPNYHYPTIFRLFRNQYPQKKIAVFSSWLDNRTKLIGEGLAATGNIRLDYHADGYELDTLRFPHDKGREFMLRIDRQVVQEAVNTLQKQAPDLSWVYLEYTDDMGHMYGDSEAFYRSVQQTDSLIGQLARAVQYRQQQHNEEWLLVVTTDHGRDEQTGKSHGGQSIRQRSGWIVSNQRLANTYAQYFQPGIVDIMPTIARFMNIAIPADVQREVDGIPLLGPVSLAGVEVNHFQGKLDIRWQALEPEGRLKVWLAEGNAYKTGGKDQYRLLGEVPLAQKYAVMEVGPLPAAGYKLYLEGPSSSVNTWVIPQTAKQ
jgi:hypothetical protein